MAPSAASTLMRSSESTSLRPFTTSSARPSWSWAVPICTPPWPPWEADCSRIMHLCSSWLRSLSRRLTLSSSSSMRSALSPPPRRSRTSLWSWSTRRCMRMNSASFMPPPPMFPAMGAGIGVGAE
jgi:hypothetical protein